MQVVAKADRNETRLEMQAEALQALIARLMEPPMEPGDHRLPDVELSPREIRVLLLLGAKGNVIMTDLAAAVPAPLSTVTRIIDRLENKKLVERYRSRDDRRIVVVRQARKGRLLHDRFRQKQLEAAARMLRPLNAGEREALLALLSKLSLRQ